MKERPILFSGEMIKAIITGRKTQTRRVVIPRSKPNIAPLEMEPWHSDDEQLFRYDKQFELIDGRVYCRKDGLPVWIGKHPSYAGEKFFACPYGKVGDRLWVRETWANYACQLVYRADYHQDEFEYTMTRWKSSIHMPRWASRLSLEITNVRVEHLQDISEDDAQAEGVRLGFDWIGHLPILPANFRAGFRLLWNSIYAKQGHGWDSNPWVWVVEFRRVES